MNSKDNKNLTNRFHEYFNVELATTQEQKEKVYHIRYRVYCDEFKFLDADDYTNEMEIDEYDDFSTSCLITHKSSGFPAACVRIVPAISARGDHPLPYEKLGPDILDQEFFSDFDEPRDSLCEISRLAVDGAFRRRSGELATRFGEIDALDITHVEKRTFGLIAVATFLASAAAADLTNQASAFAMMEPFLPKLMKRSGIQFQRAGKDTDYHGLRAPYFIRMESFLDTMHSDLRDFYSSVYECVHDSHKKSTLA
jgi:N-acyl amino acid synthase of PEP-CTERM/exosortase system